MMSEGIYKYYRGFTASERPGCPCQPPFKGLVETKDPVKANYKSAGAAAPQVSPGTQGDGGEGGNKLR